jgi:CheY-like chemotaxis protein
MPQASIFIVEDELIVSEDLRQTLEDLGYTVGGVAHSGEDALAGIGSALPDLVLMDVRLAGAMDGIETAGLIRDRFGLPVIFLTAHSDKANVARAKLTGPYGYLLKPFSDRELHTTIEMALSRYHLDLLTREKERTIRVLANAIPDPVMLLDRRLKILAANDAMVHNLRTDRPDEWQTPVFLPENSGRYAALLPRIAKALSTLVPGVFEEQEGDTWYEISLFPVAGPDPEDPLLLIQYHDITARKRFEEELRTGGLSQIEQNMEQFQILNDEIRNPLQAILGYVNMDCRKHQGDIIEQIRAINNLVHRLDHGWIESGKIRQFLIRHYLEEVHPGRSAQKES